MLRSHCPSQAAKKRPSDGGEEEMVSAGRSGRKRKRVNYAADSDEEENLDPVNQRTVELLNESLGVDRSRKLFDIDEEARRTHESFIRSLLSKPYKMPLSGYMATYPTLGCRMGQRGRRRALYDPEDPNALILYEPPQLTEMEQMKVKDEDVRVHVLVDPMLARVLRPHQRAGVKFLYSCVTGQAVKGFHGSIMADEMGLGKTLQCVTLIWTLAKQSPTGEPTAKLSIVVSPSSLVKNWQNEFTKWLGQKCSTMAIDGGSKKEIDVKLEQFCSQTVTGRIHSPVLFISYETFRLHAKVLNRRPIGLLICDEGHRLKNPESQTYLALNQLDCQRRVLLSGTPIQNDLLEYFSLVNFVNPGLLGTAQEFRKNFENPILKSRDADCTDKEKERGEECLKALLALVNQCMIRRTNDILAKYLPPKVEMVVAIPLLESQKQMYLDFAERTKSVEAGPSSLQAITALKKICNHPALVHPLIDEFQFLTKHFDGYDPKHFDPLLSSKMMLLDSILAATKAATDDKFVLVSNYTQTLDVCQELCRLRGYGYCRLDGTMAIKKRAKLVAQFNDKESEDFIFMLSSKAGGCGLNLIGANRLVMFDPDWNPANDDQAMARVWRDGQKKRCFIYRLVAAGTIEEKMLQRQLHKKALSGVVVDEYEESRRFSVSELKELFRFKQSKSVIHDSLNCKRCVNGVQVKQPEKGGDPTDLGCWNHSEKATDCPDVVLRRSWAQRKTAVSFLFHNQSHEQIVEQKK